MWEKSDIKCKTSANQWKRHFSPLGWFSLWYSYSFCVLSVWLIKFAVLYEIRVYNNVLLLDAHWIIKVSLISRVCGSIILLVEHGNRTTKSAKLYKSFHQAEMEIFIQIKQLLTILGLIELNRSNAQQIRKLLVAFVICVLTYALLTTSYAFIFNAKTLEERTLALSYVICLLYALSEFCIFLWQRTTSLDLFQDLHSLINNRKFNTCNFWLFCRNLIVDL